MTLQKSILFWYFEAKVHRVVTEYEILDFWRFFRVVNILISEIITRKCQSQTYILDLFFLRLLRTRTIINERAIKRQNGSDVFNSELQSYSLEIARRIVICAYIELNLREAHMRGDLFSEQYISVWVCATSARGCNISSLTSWATQSEGTLTIRSSWWEGGKKRMRVPGAESGGEACNCWWRV